jgi:hypothetical protein
MIIQIHKSDPTKRIVNFLGNSLLIVLSAVQEGAKIYDWYLGHVKKGIRDRLYAPSCWGNMGKIDER